MGHAFGLHQAFNHTLAQEASKLLPGGVNSASRIHRGLLDMGGDASLYISSGAGAKVFDADGNSYVDYHCCAGSAMFGHRPPFVHTAICSQLTNGVSFSASHPLEVEVARLLKIAIPELDLLRFCNSGSEAAYAAIGVARTATNRSKVIAFDGCYHGWINTGANDASFLNLPLSDLKIVESCFREHSNQVAAVIIEPIPASNGLLRVHEEFLSGLRKACTREGAVLIFDEMITGMRLCRGGTNQYLGISPDLMILGKAISGSMPLAVFGGRADLMRCLTPCGDYRHGGTFAAHPLSLAASRSVINELDSADCYSKLDSIANALEQGLRTIALMAGTRLDILRVGSILSLYSGSIPNSRAEQSKCLLPSHSALQAALLQRGVFLQPKTPNSWFLSAAHGEEEVSLTLTAFEDALKRTCA